MTIAPYLDAMRADAEERMLDTFDIGLPTGGYEYDPGTDAEVETVTPLFTTPGRVKSTGTIPRDAEAGGRTVTTVNRELHIPVDSPVVPAGAVAVCTAVHATTDPTLLNARLRLPAAAPGSQTTARRLLIEEVLT